MRTVAHLSDLKIGATAPAVLTALSDFIDRLQPSVVAVAGNLTNTGQPGDLRGARAFLDTLPSPQVVVPGDRDFGNSRYNRLLSTSASFFTAIEPKSTPCFADREIIVIGADMTKASQIKHDGRDEVDQKNIDQLLITADADSVCVMVGCRPGFALQERASRRHVDLVLTGTPDPMDIVGDGTSLILYTEDWEEGLAFNFLRIAPPEIIVERYGWKEAHAEFRLLRSETLPFNVARSVG
jgi:hypothetical protein